LFDANYKPHPEFFCISGDEFDEMIASTLNIETSEQFDHFFYNYMQESMRRLERSLIGAK